MSGGGFWVGSSEADRVFVEIEGRAQPAQRVRAGQRVSFVGELVANTPQHLDELGVTAGADRAQLERQGHHVDVADHALRVG